MEMELCNQFQDLDCENNQPQYFAGFYNIYKNGNVIFTYYFIFDKEMSQNRTERKCWTCHQEVPHGSIHSLSSVKYYGKIDEEHQEKERERC